METTTGVGGVEMMLAEVQHRRIFVYYIVGERDVAAANEMNVNGEC